MKYRIGDRVRDIDTGRAGTIVGIWMDRFVIHYYDDDDNRSIEYAGDIEFLDKKQTFLERLQGLLRDFDASIYDYEQYKLCIDLGGGEQLEWSWSGKTYAESQLTAENVFDYDKD